jgi:hypothetical protein
MFDIKYYNYVLNLIKILYRLLLTILYIIRIKRISYNVKPLRTVLK